LNVLLIEDHVLFREGVTLILERLADDIHILCSGSAEGGLEQARANPDLQLVLLDYNLPNSNGIDCLHQLLKLLPNTPLVMLSAENNSGLIQRALKMGAKGFITKNSSSKIMLSAIKLVLSGGVYIPPAALENNDSPISGSAPKDQVSQASATPNREASSELNARGNSNYQLTGRQREVLAEMAKGLSNKEIAQILNMSPSTVKVHVAAILREFEVKNRTQAVNFAREKRITEC